LRKLIRGIVEFREQTLPDHAQRFRDLAYAQTPDALFITCADSRVVPNLMVSTEPGDLFTVRNVGNLMPPADHQGHSEGDLSEASAIEYAVSVLKVPNIVVCGHSECGAMKAVLGGKADSLPPNLAKWLHHAHPAARRLASGDRLDPSLSEHDQLSQLNVLAQLEHLMTYRVVRDQVEAGTLTLSGWWFDIGSGDVLAYRDEHRAFVIIDRENAERWHGPLFGPEQVS
jgi:carbonic anhydrase